LHDWVNPAQSSNKKEGRCFFKSTTAGASSLRDDFFEKELHEVRPFVHEAGCEYLDYAYLTEIFTALGQTKDWRANAERGAVFWDSLHFMPWVYEELNQLLLNVLCNSKKLSEESAS
jgi:hypothetical protein